MTWARRARLDRARELLLTGRRSIPAIAKELGWSSADAFAKRFRSETGLAPGAFRRRDQK
jgi:transcriptional regulator GlxA family with amidase domain